METDWLQVEGSFGSDRCRLLGEKEIDQRSELDRLCEQARYKRSKVTGPTCRWLMCGPQSVRTSSSPCCEWPESQKDQQVLATLRPNIAKRYRLECFGFASGIGAVRGLLFRHVCLRTSAMI
jgi:hypothetical protein